MSTSTKEDASRVFFESQYGNWSVENRVALKKRLAGESEFARAYREVESSWTTLGQYAETAEIAHFREEARAKIRLAATTRGKHNPLTVGGRWAASFAGLGLAIAVAWQVLPYGVKPGEYRTGVGELRRLELDDRTIIAIDAATKIKVDYSNDARVVQLLNGQAQFSVAPDPVRPFKVRVGDHTIVALGTVFTVEYADQELNVAMLDGRVAVLSATSNSVLSPTRSQTQAERPSARDFELSAGQALRLNHDEAVVLSKADVEAATAWREGKVILRDETMEDAVKKMNRYSRVELKINDPSLAKERISGIFEAGNSQGFVDDVKQILPVEAIYLDKGSIELRRR